MTIDEDAAPVSVRRVELDSLLAQGLIRELNAELKQRYPEPGATHFRLEADEVAEGRGAFLVAFKGDEPAGCGAVRRIGEDTAEIKRMYVRSAARGRGVGRAILEALVAEARRIGMQRLLLETGERQPEALGLYHSAGFVPAPRYGEYVGSPVSICLGKDL